MHLFYPDILTFLVIWGDITSLKKGMNGQTLGFDRICKAANVIWSFIDVPPRSRWKPLIPWGHHGYQQEGWPGDPKFLG